MWPHLISFSARIGNLWLSHYGTNIVGLAAGFVPNAITAIGRKRTGESMRLMAADWGSTVSIVGAVWFALLLWCIGEAVYKDHLYLVDRNAAKIEIIHMKTKELNDKQDEIDNVQKPNLEGEIIQAGSFDLIVPPNGHLTNYPSNSKIPTALLWAKIKNHGADSIAENYQLTITLNDGKQLQTQMLAIPKDIRPKDWRQRLILDSSASLVEKTVERPIVRGGQDVGLLMFVIDPSNYLRSDLTKKGVAYTLSFTDSVGKKYQAKKTLFGEGRRDPAYVPGAGPN